MSKPIVIRDELTKTLAMSFIDGLNLSKAWEVIVRQKRSKRSLDQNALYWKICTELGNSTGNAADDIHEFLKAKFLPPRFVDVGGETKEIRRSTAALNTQEMTTYLDQIYGWAASDLGIALPHPDDLGRAA